MSSSTSPQQALARRAFIEDVKQDKKSWLQHGVAALAVSLLGLGVAGSIALTGAAQSTSTDAAPAARSSVSTQTSTREANTTSRSTNRAPLDAAKVQSLADQRAEELSKDDEAVSEAATGKAADARDKALKSESVDATAEARKIAAGQVPSTSTVPATDQGSTTVESDGKSCLPAASYSVAARFGQVGSWARYHTGFDFAAPVGTTLRAPSAGVVTNAGLGSASGWAGNYVAIRYPDGTQSLMAHMSTVSVSVGQTVTGCQVVGAIGMTGRTFGPHVHFEIYPAGITPGDVYKAVNPVPWLNAHGLKP